MAVRRIGVSARDQRFGERDHFRHMMRRVRVGGGRQDAERAHVVQIGLLELRGDFGCWDAARLGGGHHLVVDVGDVAGIDDVVRAIAPAQQAEQHVKNDGRTRIADMGEVVDGRAADIHGDPVRIGGREGLLFGGEGIV